VIITKTQDTEENIKKGNVELEKALVDGGKKNN